MGATPTKLAQAEYEWIFSWESGCVGGGGIIRNANGEWVGGYARAIGITTRVAIELWALRDGLNMCIELNLLTVDYRVGCKIGCGSLKETGWEFKWE